MEETGTTFFAIVRNIGGTLKIFFNSKDEHVTEVGRKFPWRTFKLLAFYQISNIGRKHVTSWGDTGYFVSEILAVCGST